MAILLFWWVLNCSYHLVVLLGLLCRSRDHRRMVRLHESVCAQHYVFVLCCCRVWSSIQQTYSTIDHCASDTSDGCGYCAHRSLHLLLYRSCRLPRSSDTQPEDRPRDVRQLLGALRQILRRRLLLLNPRAPPARCQAQERVIRPPFPPPRSLSVCIHRIISYLFFKKTQLCFYSPLLLSPCTSLPSLDNCQASQGLVQSAKLCGGCLQDFPVHGVPEGQSRLLPHFFCVFVSRKERTNKCFAVSSYKSKKQ